MSDSTGREIEYQGHGRAKITAYLAETTQEGARPGLLLHHEASGLSDFPRDIADQLAAQGYNVIAPDMYSRLPHPITDMAAAYKTMSDDQTLADLDAALEFLKSETNHNGKFGIIGFCTGNPIVYSGHSDQMSACVSFYNQLMTDSQWNHAGNRNPMDSADDIHGAWLGLYGDVDTTISVEQLQTFEGKLKSAGKNYQLEIYADDNVGHGFQNPKGQAYKPAQAKDAWDKATNFLAQNLQTS